MSESYGDLRREYEAQHCALVEAQRAWMATGELRDKAEAEIERLRAALSNIKILTTGDARPRWDNSFETTTTRGMIADLCDHALGIQ